MNDLVKLPNDSFEITSTGLIIHGQPSFQQFKQCWYSARKTSKHLAIIVADLLIYGCMTYGEAMAQLLDEESDSPIFTQATLQNLKYTFSRFPPSRRRELKHVPISYYQELAPLPEPEQDRILDKIVESRRANHKDPTKPRLGRDWIRQEKKRLGIKQLENKSEADYQKMIDAVIQAIDALAEVYPPGLEEIKDYLRRHYDYRKTDII